MEYLYLEEYQALTLKYWALKLIGHVFQARPQAASRGPFRPRIFQLDQPDDATLECSIG